ncbi:MAG: histidinol-phosphatase HisJ family protein [Candidatus Bathyarchaeia archaeon]
MTQKLSYQLVDYHVHSLFSADGRSSIEELCESAVQIGLSEIGFAEHLDFGSEGVLLDYEKYTSTIEKVKEKFEGILTIRKGVEVDYQTRYLDEITQWLKERDFEFTIGSVHFVNGKPIDLGILDPGTLASLYPSYCHEVILSIKSGLFNIIGHFDLISLFTKVSKDVKKIHVPMVLEALLNSDVHLEINSRGFREGRNETIPGTEILQDYFRLGGSRVSIGSDAHSANAVGSGVRESFELVIGMKPTLLQLPFKMR